MLFDNTTLHLSGALMNATYGTLCVMMWATQPQSRHFLLWACGSFSASAGLLSFAFFVDTHLAMTAVAFSGIAFGMILSLAGVRWFDGRPAVTLAMVLAGLAPALAYTVPTALFQTAPAVGDACATVFLAVAACQTGAYFLRPVDGRRSLMRRAAGGTLLAFLPFFAASIVGSLFVPGPRDMTLILLINQVATNILAMSLAALPGERTRRALADLSRLDPLTGALNRNGLARATAGLDPTGQALILADLDHFKAVNDVHGHAAGDEVLRTFVTTIRQVLGPQDLVARLGGEEFVMVLLETSRAQALATAERLRAAVEAAPALWNERRIPVTVSLGVVTMKPGEPVLAAAERADRALYAAKSAGRNRVAA